jgi:hypothetical protein
MPIVRKDICVYMTGWSNPCVGVDSYSVPNAANGNGTVTVTNTDMPSGKAIEAVWWTPTLFDALGINSILENLHVDASTDRRSVILTFAYTTQQASLQLAGEQFP